MPTAAQPRPTIDAVAGYDLAVLWGANAAPAGSPARLACSFKGYNVINETIAWWDGSRKVVSSIALGLGISNGITRGALD